MCVCMLPVLLPSGLGAQGPHGGTANVTGQSRPCQDPANNVTQGARKPQSPTDPIQTALSPVPVFLFKYTGDLEI